MKTEKRSNTNAEAKAAIAWPSVRVALTHKWSGKGGDHAPFASAVLNARLVVECTGALSRSALRVSPIDMVDGAFKG